jgi:hypothetical protein
VSTAAVGARRDVTSWRCLLAEVVTHLPDVREVDVTGFDPRADLARRGEWWGHILESDRLAEVLAFGVALAEVEVEAWERNDPVVATRAFEDRRFLYSDRMVHWVVPVTFRSDRLADLREEMLRLGDRLRVAPLLTGDEGLHPPGEDSFGRPEVELRLDLGPIERWERLALDHPGTARLWRDLARRLSGRSDA